MKTSSSSAKSFIGSGVVFAGMAVATWLLMNLGYLRGGNERYGLLFATAGTLLLLGLLSHLRSKRLKDPDK
ncbi:MAG: hypothetical protein M3R52_01205 [Acidobacteriota bacterium]|nr:hypothetical protein [Acidobacteriota bacterium]